MDDHREHDDGLNQGYESANNVNYTRSPITNKYVEEDDDEVEDDEEHEEANVGDNEMNQTNQQNGDNDDDNDDDDGDDDNGEDHSRHPKKRKLKSLLSSYEFAPRVPPPTSAPKPSFGGRNTLTDWTEHETFVLLEAWGDRFLKCGKKSLRSEEWQEVAERVNQISKIVRTDSQCRNRLDTLKKKYKKEKANLKGSRIVNNKWVYFKKMDMLLSSGEIATNPVINPNFTSNNTNGVYETRGSSGNSDHHKSFNDNDDGYDDDDDDDEDDDDLLPPKRSKPKRSFKLLADSINKFSKIYEKIENGKIQQMIELEKMRMDFHRDLELERRQFLNRAQNEFIKKQGDFDVSAENVSG